MCTTLSVSAQKKRAKTKGKAQPAKVVTPKLASVPVESLAGKAFSGAIGKTVVDFFGNRNTYGDVTHDIYITPDHQNVIIRQAAASEVIYFIEPMKYADGTFTADAYKYSTTADGGLYLTPMKVGDEQRQGTLSSAAPDNILHEMYQYGKYLSGMTIQTDEDIQNAKLLLSVTAEKGVEGAAETASKFYKKLSEKGDTDATQSLLKKALKENDYATAHDCYNKLIEQNPDNCDLLAENGLLYVKEGKMSEAKAVWKKLRKLNRNFADTSSHPFCLRMRL